MHHQATRASHNLVATLIRACKETAPPLTLPVLCRATWTLRHVSGYKARAALTIPARPRGIGFRATIRLRIEHVDEQNLKLKRARIAPAHRKTGFSPNKYPLRKTTFDRKTSSHAASFTDNGCRKFRYSHSHSQLKCLLYL